MKIDVTSTSKLGEHVGSGRGGASSAKRWAVGVIVGLLAMGLGGCGNTTASSPGSSAAQTNVQNASVTGAAPTTTTAAPVTTVAPTTTSTPASVGASSNSDGGTSYYTNSSGNQVESPDANSSGATAKCNDGTYSHSQHRSGTCSGHGGVAAWL